MQRYLPTQSGRRLRILLLAHLANEMVHCSSSCHACEAMASCSASRLQWSLQTQTLEPLQKVHVSLLVGSNLGHCNPYALYTPVSPADDQ